MRTKRKALWLLVPLPLLIVAAWLVPSKDVFDELGQPEPEDFPRAGYRRWKVRGTEESARRRIEKMLAQDGGWYLASRGTHKVSREWTNVFYWYRNNDLDGDAQIQYIAAREADDRVFFDVSKPVGWSALKRRFSLWWQRHHP